MQYVVPAIVIFLILVVLGIIAYALSLLGWLPSWWPTWLGGPPPAAAPTPIVPTPPPPPPTPGRYVLNISGPTHVTGTQVHFVVTVNYNPGAASWAGMTQSGHTVKAFIHAGRDGQVTSTLDGIVQATSDRNGIANFFVRATGDGDEDKLEATITNLSPNHTGSFGAVTPGTHEYSTSVP